MQVIQVTPVLDTNAYADNDVLFVPIEVPSFRRSNTNIAPRKLVSVTVLDQADQAQDIDLIFTDGTVTLGTINGAVNISDSDAQKVLAKVSVLIANYTDLVNSQCATVGGLDTILAPATSLYLSGVCRSGTPTYAAASLLIRLGFED